MYCGMRAELTLPHPMGLIYAEVEVRREDGPSRKVKFLVDSGAMLSVLPWSVWHALGLEPRRSMRFSLADGRTMRRRISDCRFRFRGIDAPIPVILGERVIVFLGQFGRLQSQPMEGNESIRELCRR